MQINSAKDLKVYQEAYALAMEIFEQQKVAVRGKVFANGSNQACISIGLYKSS